MPPSATNTTGRSRTVLNRIVLVAKGGEPKCLNHSTKGSSTYEKHTWLHGTSTCNQLGYRDSNPGIQESKSCALPLGNSPMFHSSANVIQSLTPIDQLFSRELSFADLSYTGCSDFSLWCSASLSRFSKSPALSGCFDFVICILSTTLKIGGRK